MRRTLILLVACLLWLGLGANPAAAENIRINGSTTVLPIVQEVAEAYMEENPGVNISISGGGSGNGIKAIIDGTTDICQTSRWIRPSEVELAVENGVYPVPFGIALDSIIPVVHPENQVEELSLEELRKIYKGEITNWEEVGGMDRRIMVVSRDSDSGTYGVWNDNVLQGDRVTPRSQMLASNGAIVQAVQDNRHAIGYIGIGYMTDKLQKVKVDGVLPTHDTTVSGEYPVSRTLWLITDNWPTGETKRFIDFLLHPEKGQPLVGNTGYVPLY